jgi:transcriptional regulator with XRE-family HTH domain
MEQAERQQRLVAGLIDSGLISRTYSGCEDSVVQVIGRLLGEGAPEFSHKLVQGRRLAYVRTEVKGWSQQMLLDRVNIYLEQVLAPRIGGHTTISRIETGQYDMSYATGLAFAMALGVSPSAFSPWLAPINFGGASLLPSPESLDLDHAHH